MKTKMEEIVEYQKLAEKRKEDQDFLDRRIARIREYISDLRETPYVKVPLRCKLHLHKLYYFPYLDESHRPSNVAQCLKCGAIFTEWWDNSNFASAIPKIVRYFEGYSDPNNPEGKQK